MAVELNSKIEVFGDRQGLPEWRVEYVDDDGGCYVTIFAGPFAEKRAREYAEALKARKLAPIPNQRSGSKRKAAAMVAFVLISVAMLFAGCAGGQQSPEAQAKEDKAAAQEAAKQISSIDDAKCQSFGAPGSRAYTQCRKDLDSERKRMGTKE